MPPVWSKIEEIDNVTKSIVTGWCRQQQTKFNIVNIPTSLIGVCMVFYYLREVFDIGPECDYFKEYGMTMKLTKFKRCVSLVSKEKNYYWQAAYGTNEILINNVDSKYIYIWKLKMHKMSRNTNYEHEHPFVYIGFNECTKDGYDKIRKYCSNGYTKVWGYNEKDTRYGKGFGVNDNVSVLLNTQTMEVRMRINEDEQSESITLFKENKQTKVKLSIFMNGPNVEIELIKFDRERISN